MGSPIADAVPTELAGVPDDRLMWESWLSRTWFPALMVADDLGIFSSLAEAPARPAELANRLSLSCRGTTALLPLIAALGFLRADRGLYRLTTAASANLIPNSPYYWGGVLAESIKHDPIAARLKEVLTDPAADDAPDGSASRGGQGRWADDWAAATLGEETARSISAFMHSHSAAPAARLAAAVSLAKCERLLDVAGGSGCYAIALARMFPRLRCTVLELPAACGIARRYIAAAGVGDRVDVVSCDMFRQPWPAGYDAVFMSNVLHDWSLPLCQALVQRACDALPVGGRILVHEMLLDEDGGGPRTAAAFSVLVALGTRGRQLTFSEVRKVLEQARFVDVQRTSVPPLFDLVEGSKSR